MDPGRLVVTMLGLVLVLAVNLYFFARPGAGRAPRRPGGPSLGPGPQTADEASGEGRGAVPPGLTLTGHAPARPVPSSKQP